MSLQNAVRSQPLFRYRALFLIVVYAVLGTGLFFEALRRAGAYATYVPNTIWALAWFALVFYLAWWAVYYQFSEEPDDETPFDPEDGVVSFPNRRIVTLRSFLTHNTPRGKPEAAGEALAEKASGTVKAVGVIVGFSLLVFSFTVQILFTGDVTLVRENILTGVLGLQVVAVSSFLIAIDSLDTTANEFTTFTDEMAYRRRQKFYNRGIVAYYRGLAVLVLSMFLLTMTVRPIVTIIGVLIFALYGYHYWFAYEHVDH